MPHRASVILKGGPKGVVMRCKHSNEPKLTYNCLYDLLQRFLITNPNRYMALLESHTSFRKNQQATTEFKCCINFLNSEDPDLVYQLCCNKATRLLAGYSLQMLHNQF